MMKIKAALLKLVTLVLLFAGFTATAQRKPAKFNHMAIYVVDLEKATVFYRDILQIDTIPEPFHDGRHTWFRLGETGQFHVISGIKEAVAHEKNAHLCFSVASMDDMITRLKKYNIDFENLKGENKMQTTRVDGIKQIYLKDPDGYWVEINNDYR
ncbi:MAG: VOC family protein [Chitinophagaceae bacterium]